ncbi:MAG: hypothetical protein HDR07_01575 [Lachnospiraceae bacterium]|nr:hypothetical protein [Lachnospiraceae bacterium]
MRRGKNKIDKTAICKYLDRIIGKPVSRIGRAANMVWICIGKNVMTVDWKGRKREKSEYALHIQSPWRIINKKKDEIVMASSDMYSPRTGMDYSEDFNWEPQGNNLFDEKSKNWLKREIPVYIKKYKLSRWGDLTLFFSNNEKLQVFNEASGDTESWRLLMPGSKEPHLVASGSEIIFE